MNLVRTSRLPMLRALLAALGYVAVIAVLLVLVWSAVADILDRRKAIAASSDLLAQLGADHARDAAASIATKVPAAC